MPESNSNSSSPVPSNPPPPIPPRARSFLAWASWILLLGGPSFGGAIALLLDGTPAKACTILLGFMVSAAAGIKGGLAVPWKAPPEAKP
ncbi:hypothetical protein LCGC14_0258330 [marine sediment metagenome]|uniref:Uncharacterized protein n=1 Tax=marine sediment metagenome TaxID=412755 RepID=A0A0F9X738_9ZZZZ